MAVGVCKHTNMLDMLLLLPWQHLPGLERPVRRLLLLNL
jgi:hypothetical protein